MDIIEKARVFFERATEIDSARKLMAGGPKRVLFQTSDGPGFVVEFSGDTVRVSGADEKRVDLSLEADTQTYLALFEGALSPAAAFHSRKLFFDGIPYKGYPWVTRMIKIIQTNRAGTN